MSLMSNIWPLTQVFSRMTLVRLWRNVPVKNRRAVRRRRWLSEIYFCHFLSLTFWLKSGRRFILFFYSAKLTKLLDLIWNLLKLKISSLVRKIFNCFFFPNISAVSEGERAARVITQPTQTIFPEFHSFFSLSTGSVPVQRQRSRMTVIANRWAESFVAAGIRELSKYFFSTQQDEPEVERGSCPISLFFFFHFFVVWRKKKKTPSLN